METNLITTDTDDDLDNGSSEWVMKKLKPKHIQICALLAQGLKNIEVASIAGCTKEYITMLLRQPLMQAEISRISSVAQHRLEAMFEKSVDVIGEAMTSGTKSEQLKAARLHGELTKRIGRPDPMANSNTGNEDRLLKLAERLTGLLGGTRKGNTFDESGQEIGIDEKEEPGIRFLNG